jgi:integrase
MPRTKSKPKARRSYGDGAIKLRGTIWWVVVYVDGKRIQKSTGSRDREEALQYLARMQRERSRGELVAINEPSAQGTIGGVLDDYLARRSRLAPGTLTTYELQVRRYLKPHFGLLPVEKLTTDMLSEYRSARGKEQVCNWNAPEETKRKARTVTDTSINREVGLLRSAMRDYAKRYPNRLPTLPYFPMESERGNARQGFITETDFINKLYPAMPRHLKALSACAFYAGGRKSEWLQLNWTEVDFEQLIIRFVKTKNKEQREVPIVAGLMLDSLLDLLRLRNIQTDWDQQAVFCYDGKRMASPKRAWANACKRAGFENLLFHDMRRSSNKNMRDSGVSQPVRMKLLGHKTPSMDIRYGITDLNDVADAREKLELVKKGPGRHTLLPEPVRKVR